MVPGTSSESIVHATCVIHVRYQCSKWVLVSEDVHVRMCRCLIAGAHSMARCTFTWILRKDAPIVKRRTLTLVDSIECMSERHYQTPQGRREYSTPGSDLTDRFVRILLQFVKELVSSEKPKCIILLLQNPPRVNSIICEII